MIQQLTKRRIDKFICELFIKAVNDGPSPFLFSGVNFESSLTTFKAKVLWSCDGSMEPGQGLFADFVIENETGEWSISMNIDRFDQFCDLFHNYDSEDPRWFGIANIEIFDEHFDVETQLLELVLYGKDEIVKSGKTI